jgi:sterol desaturase/sphingolipid hydroxylase (fatty acid hydroxylase superfamily)
MDAYVKPVAVSAAILVALAAVFAVIERAGRGGPRRRWLRPGLSTDVAYWFLHTLVTRYSTRLAVAIVAVPIAYLIYGQVSREAIMGGFGPASRLPLAVQAIVILVVSDLVHYWMHRLMHGRRLWPFHAVHHSSEHLDWLAAVRGHPVNDAIMRIAATLPLLASGLAPIAVIGLTPLFLFMALLLHADVTWDWGPLRTVIASPRFHRWHHTSEAEGRDKNFAALFPVWDILFGTYYMPQGRLPVRFGTDTPVPSGILAQLAFPFRRSS